MILEIFKDGSMIDVDGHEWIIRHRHLYEAETDYTKNMNMIRFSSSSPYDKYRIEYNHSISGSEYAIYGYADVTDRGHKLHYFIGNSAINGQLMDFGHKNKMADVIKKLMYKINEVAKLHKNSMVI